MEKFLDDELDDTPHSMERFPAVEKQRRHVDSKTLVQSRLH